MKTSNNHTGAKQSQRSLNITTSIAPQPHVGKRGAENSGHPEGPEYPSDGWRIPIATLISLMGKKIPGPLKPCIPKIKPYKPYDAEREERLRTEHAQVEAELVELNTDLTNCRHSIRRLQKAQGDKPLQARAWYKWIGLIGLPLLLMATWCITTAIGGSYILANSTSASLLSAYGLAAVGALTGPVLKSVIGLLKRRVISIPELSIMVPVALVGIALSVSQVTEKFFYLQPAAPLPMMMDFTGGVAAPDAQAAPVEKTSLALLYSGVLMMEAAFSYALLTMIVCCARTNREDRLHELRENCLCLSAKIKRPQQRLIYLRGKLAACERVKAVYNSPDAVFNTIKDLFHR